jgi:uncharacterized protein (UPF0332 family)
MIPEISELLERARLSQKAAGNLLRDGFPGFAASRAYYSMFYVAQALLLSKDMSFSSHSAVIAAYGKEFAKTKLLNPEFHRLLLEAQDKRNIGDYGMIGGIDDTEAQEILALQRRFTLLRRFEVRHFV